MAPLQLGKDHVLHRSNRNIHTQHGSAHSAAELLHAERAVPPDDKIDLPATSGVDSVELTPRVQGLTGGITIDATGAETYGTVVVIAESYMKPGYLWAGTDDGNVWFTRNDGAVWEQIPMSRFLAEASAPSHQCLGSTLSWPTISGISRFPGASKVKVTSPSPVCSTFATWR